MAPGSLEGLQLVVSDIQAEADVYAPVKARTSTRAALYQPLKHQGRVLGVLIVGSLQAGCFDQADLDYLGRYAEYAAVAMANAQLHAALVLSLRAQDELERGEGRRPRAAPEQEVDRERDERREQAPEQRGVAEREVHAARPWRRARNGTSCSWLMPSLR